jgi:predicted transposase YbfD/YdcC
MNPAPAGSLLTYLSQVPDPRGRQGLRHPLSAMLAVIVCSILSGLRGCSAFAEWVHSQPPEVWHLLGFTRKPPCKNCFRDLLIALDAEAFEDVLSQWAANTLKLSPSPEDLEAVSLDGKTLCGTLTPHQKAVHLLAVLDQKTGGVLRQTAVDEKTNEHKAALPLLKALVLEGRVVVADAIFCQKEVCEQIRDGGGHYFVTVKDNQPTLKREIETAFADPKAFSPLGRAEFRRAPRSCRNPRQEPWPDRVPHGDEHDDPERISV